MSNKIENNFTYTTYVTNLIYFYFSLAKWLVPPKKDKKKDRNFWKSLKETWETRKKKVQAAWQLYAFLGFIFGMNAILFITRAYYFRGMLMLDPEITNVFYMLSRACGESKAEKVVPALMPIWFSILFNRLNMISYQ